MASETSPKEHYNMGVSPPPAYKGRDRTKLYVVAAVILVAVLVVVGFAGVCYLLVSSPTPPPPSVVNNVSTVVERDVTYEMGGVEHHERMKAEGNLLTIQGTGDGFTAVIDLGRNIMTIKNETTGVCFFARAVDLNVTALNTMEWLFVKESDGNEESLMSSDPNTRVVIFDAYSTLRSDRVPLVSSPTVARQCKGESYWIVPQHQRVKRSCRWCWRGWSHFWKEVDKVVEDTAKVVVVVDTVSALAG